MDASQLEKIRSQPGFIAALDQSGGSTPEGAELYGISEDAAIRATTRCST